MMVIWSYLGVLYEKVFHIFIVYIDPLVKRETPLRSFADNLGLTLDTLTNSNPFLILDIDNFHAKTYNLYYKDKTSYKGLKTDAITSQFGSEKLNNEPTHIIENSSSCIDLTFTIHSKVAMESGVDSSFHPNCHHQTVFTKSDLRMVYPPPYERENWHYDKANTDLSRRSIHESS